MEAHIIVNIAIANPHKSGTQIILSFYIACWYTPAHFWIFAFWLLENSDFARVTNGPEYIAFKSSCSFSGLYNIDCSEPFLDFAFHAAAFVNRQFCIKYFALQIFRQSAEILLHSVFVQNRKLAGQKTPYACKRCCPSSISNLSSETFVK